MRLTAFLGLFLLAMDCSAQISASRWWTDLKTKRDNLSWAHQEFDVSKTQQGGDHAQSRKWQIVVDISMGRWREAGGFAAPTRIFDGKDILSFEQGEPEYLRTRVGSSNDRPVPSPYKFDEFDWAKAVVREGLPCELTNRDDKCIALDIPLKPWIRSGTNSHATRLVSGLVRVIIDLETGLLMSSRTIQVIESETCTCQSDVSYVLKRETYGGKPDSAFFTLPPGTTREVKQLPRWNAARIRKDLTGKPVPELVATGLDGVPVALSTFRGKTVLLDFWASWCPPCRADASALRKLHERYGNKNLEIIGISVSEDRKIVQEFLNEHPAGYPIILSSENEMPRPFQVYAIPTYVIIDENGLVQSAAEGDQGFGELRKLLRKAGLDTD
ncbi:MAG: TlpA family protein disulfide reductase [Bryobacterales bacterium]|nr:TlpA family protein disulfide reductase [Bryobacterales bacterium]